MLKSYKQKYNKPPVENDVHSTEPAYVKDSDLPLIFKLEENTEDTHDIVRICVGHCKDTNDISYFCHEWRKKKGVGKAVDLAAIYQEHTGVTHIHLYDIKKTIAHQGTMTRILNQFEGNYYYAVQQCQLAGLTPQFSFGVFTESWNEEIAQREIESLELKVKDLQQKSNLPQSGKFNVYKTQDELALGELRNFFKYKMIEVDKIPYNLEVFMLHTSNEPNKAATIDVAFDANGFTAISEEDIADYIDAMMV